MTEAEMNIDHMQNAAKTIFASGTAQHRDALRVVANTVLAPNAMFACEGIAPDVETTYQLLKEIKFTGDGTQMLPADEVYALDTLLNKKWQKVFFNAVANTALTMYSTDPKTTGRGPWPKSQNDFNQLITRAFIWMLSQEGLKNVLKDPAVVSHTRLAQFMIATQLVGKDAENLRHFTLHCPDQDTGAVDCANLISDAYIEKSRAERRAKQPPEYEAAANMSFSKLADLCERLGVIGPNSATAQCPHTIDEHCDCEGTRYRTREYYEGDEEELLYDFYCKFGHPNDEDDDMADIWHEGISLMEVCVDLPIVRLPETGSPKVITARKKTAPQKARNKIVLTEEQQIWHKVGDDPLSVDRRFAITLVSRHTCPVNHPIATRREALAIAAALMDISK